MSHSHAPSVGPSPLEPDPSARSLEVTARDIVVGVLIGRTVAFFDLFVFGIACALVFPHVFFPFVDETRGMLYGFVIFALGFIAQPLGSLFFMWAQRRFGRTVQLTAALFLSGSATVGIAFVPAYALMGGAAIVALVLLRLAQGFAIGGSWNGLASLLAMRAPQSQRGWYASIPQLGAPIGFIVAAALFAYLWSALGAEEFLGWGWRYPFFVAFTINVVALFARLRLVVSPEYIEALQERDLVPAPVARLFREQGRLVVLGAFASLGSYALLNLVTLFTLSWALLHAHESCVALPWNSARLSARGRLMSRCCQRNADSLKPGRAVVPNVLGSITRSRSAGMPRRHFRNEQTDGEPTTMAFVAWAITGTSRKCSSWPCVTQMYLACRKSPRSNHFAPQ